MAPSDKDSAKDRPRGMTPASKQMAALVILVLMAMVLSFIEIPLIPGVDWLKYDPSGAVVALVALLNGPWMGVAVAVLSWIPHLVTGPIGALMNIMSSISLVLVMGFVFRGRRTLRHAVLGALGGVAAATAVSICLNFVATPFYLGTTYYDVAALVLPCLLPFNFVKAAANAAIAIVAHGKLRNLLEDGADGEQGPGFVDRPTPRP